MKNSTNIKCFEPFTILLCQWQWMTRDNKGWQGMTKVSCSAVKVCSMLCSGVTVAGQRRCYQLVCLDAVQVTRATFIRVSKNQPSSRPLAAIVSTLSTGQTTDTQHAQNWIFSVSSTQPLSRWRGWGHHTYCLGVWSIYGLIIIQLGPYYMVKFMKLNYWEF